MSADLRAVFNAAFSDYAVPLQLDHAAFRAHVEVNDIDLAASPVAQDGDRAVALALLAVRGDQAWIGGMGTVPSHRRRGLGEAVMRDALDHLRERGCRAVWLEVIDDNGAAVRLYERLGFERVRDLVVWSLAARPGPSRTRELAIDEAQAWIAAHRESREPWQRSDASLARMRERRPLGALAVEHGGQIAAALIHAAAEPLTVLQFAAVDDDAAVELLLGAADARDVRFSNAPEDERGSRALARLGARVVARQHEMRLAL